MYVEIAIRLLLRLFLLLSLSPLVTGRQLKKEGEGELKVKHLSLKLMNKLLPKRRNDNHRSRDNPR